MLGSFLKQDHVPLIRFGDFIRRRSEFLRQVQASDVERGNYSAPKQFKNNFKVFSIHPSKENRTDLIDRRKVDDPRPGTLSYPWLIYLTAMAWYWQYLIIIYNIRVFLRISSPSHTLHHQLKGIHRSIESKLTVGQQKT
jgi:hypothetical protein